MNITRSIRTLGLTAAAVICAAGASAAEGSRTRTLSISPIPAPERPVSISSLIADEAVVVTIESSPDEVAHAGEYLVGGVHGAKTRSPDRFFIGADTAVSVDVAVPGDRAVYGSLAGKKLTFRGFLIFPTSQKNDAEDAQIDIFGNILPKMVQPGTTPVFGSGKAPVVVFSHLYGDAANSAWWFVEDTARRGYAVLSFFHGDRQFASLGCESKELVALRCLVLSAALDSLQKNPLYGPHLDFSRVAAAGEGIGGTAALALAGAPIATNAGQKDFTDRRIRAALLIFGSAGPASRPFFGPGSAYAEKAGVPVCAIAQPKRDSKYRDMSGFADVSSCLKHIPSHTAVLLDGLTWSEPQISVLRTVSALFLDAAIRNDPSARSMFQSLRDVRSDIRMEIIGE